MPVKLLTASGGSVIVQGATTAVDTTATIPAANTTLVGTDTTQTLTNKTVQGGTITSGTAVSASGTSVDFTGIPSWAKRVTVMFNGVSQNSTQYIGIQIGTGSGVETTGYTTRCAPCGGSGDISTQMFLADAQGSAANLLNGIMTIVLVGSNTWVYSSAISVTSGGLQYVGSGVKTLSGTLDRVRLTTPNGTAAFDAGTINIMWEG